MKSSHPTAVVAEAPDNLAKRLFVLAMLGVVAYVGVVVFLMSSVD